MKICFLTVNPFKFGGQERIVTVIANELSKRGHEVSIIYTYNEQQNDKSIYNMSDKIEVNFCKIKSNSYIKKIKNKVIRAINEKTSFLIKNEKLLEKVYFGSVKDNQKLIDLINEKKYDIVIGVAGYFSVLLTIIKEKINCKIVGWQHSCYEAYFKTPNKYYWHLDSIYEKNIKKIDEYIVLTNADKRKMDEIFNLNCIVLNNPLSFITNKRTNLKNKTFLSLGRLEEAKGYDLLLKSFKIFTEKNSDWNLKIVGDGSKKECIKEKIKEYGLEERITLYLFTKEVDTFMADSSIFLFPSKQEGFGLVATEAFECGLPVIAYKLDPLCEIIDDNKNGFLVEKFNYQKYAEIMLSLVENPKKLNEMSKEAMVKSENYKIENIIKLWEENLKLK